MKTWKPLTKYSKFRNEVAYHTDLALEEGESITLLLPDNTGIRETCPPGMELKIHLEIAIEPFEKE